MNSSSVISHIKTLNVVSHLLSLTEGELNSFTRVVTKLSIIRGLKSRGSTLQPDDHFRRLLDSLICPHTDILSQHEPLQTGFLAGMEKLLGATTHKATTAIDARFDVHQADILEQDENRDALRQRYQHSYWESIDEGGAVCCSHVQFGGNVANMRCRNLSSLAQWSMVVIKRSRMRSRVKS